MKEMRKLIQVAVVAIGSIALIIAVPKSAGGGYVEPETQIEVTTEQLSANYEEEDDTLNEEIEVETTEVEVVEPDESTLPDTVYTTARVNIRYYVGTDTDILVTAAAGTKLTRTGINVVDGWDIVLIDDVEYCVSNEYLTTEEPDEIAKDITEQIKDAEISSSDLRYLSAIIFAEAGNQCTAGQQAVGIIVMNRSASSSFADGVYNVIYQSGQFTPATNGSLNKALSKYDSGSLPESCIEAATYALQGNKTVYYNGTTYDLSDYYYFSRYVSNARLVIEDHMFK
ncbi:MAG: cell wall hydrolase [Ruminococcus sp.]|nr:cell wall hydrolase [Ruminococcus sp.]